MSTIATLSSSKATDTDKEIKTAQWCYNGDYHEIIFNAPRALYAGEYLNIDRSAMANIAADRLALIRSLNECTKKLPHAES